MSGINGGSAVRSTGVNRSNPASSIVIDLTEDDDRDEERSEKRKEKHKEKPKEKPKENPKKKRNSSFIDLSMSSDDEPTAPATKVPGPAKPQGQTKRPENFSANFLGKTPAKVPIYQNGGTYSLVSDSESDVEPRMKVSDSVSKEVRSNLSNDTVTRQSPSRFKSDGLDMASSVPVRQGTARKSAVSHQKSNSGSVGPVSSNLSQNKKTSTPSPAARSTPGALKDHGDLSISGSTSNISRVIGKQSSSKATAPLTSGLSQLNLSTVKGNSPEIPPVASPVPLSTNDASPRKKPASNTSSAATPRQQRPSSPEIQESPISAINAPSRGNRTRANSVGSERQNDNEALMESAPRKKTEKEPSMESEARYSKLTEKEDKSANFPTQKESTQTMRKGVEREADHDKSTRENNENSNNEDNSENDNGNSQILRRTSQRDGNKSSDHAKREFLHNKILSGADIPKTRSVPYKKKGNHGGARRGPAWEKQKSQKSSVTGGSSQGSSTKISNRGDVNKSYDKQEVYGNESDEGAFAENDLGLDVKGHTFRTNWGNRGFGLVRTNQEPDKSTNDEPSDDDDDIQLPPQRKRKRGEDLNKHLSLGPSATRSESGEESRGRWEGRMDPISKGNSLTTNGSSKTGRQESTMEDIKRSLTNLKEAMLEDHGLSVNALLEKRRLRAQAALNMDFMDEESPWSCMKAADENTEGALKLNMRTTQKVNVPTYVSSVVVGDGGVDRTPSYTHHTNVMRNHLTGDDENLRYIPLVGTSNAVQNENKAMDKFVKELNAAFAERTEDPREKEQISQVDRHVDIYLEGLRPVYGDCDRSALIRYFLGHHPKRLPYPIREQKLVLKTLGGPLSKDMYETMENVAGEMNQAFNIDLENVVLSKSRFKELVESSKAQLHERAVDQPSPPERLETMAQFTCLICQGAACTTHGEYSHQKINKDLPSDDSSESDSLNRSFKKSDYEYVWEKFIMHCPDVIRKHNAQDHSEQNDNWHPEHWNTDKDTTKACGDECYRGRTGWTGFSWTQEEDTELTRILRVIKHNKPCSLVDIIDKPCWQIYVKILDLMATPTNRKQTLPRKQRSEPAEWYDPKAIPKNRALKPGWQDDTAAHMHDQRVQSVPCMHEGPCRREMNCYCVLNNLLCEQFCGCPDDCGRRFVGCSCHSEGLTCASDACVCFQMNRECGDQCNSCGAIERIRPQNRYKDELFQDGCQNIALQRGVNKKLILGKSQLQGVGFGLFAAVPIKKGDFLSEYAGEVISDNEAERRGLEYDRKYLSFLFDLNKEWIIDAAKLGNKTRFINHAETEVDGQNCAAKILLVNGEHRIAFRATRDIKIGEELFFNYGKKFAAKHGLDKKPTKANKGVVTGEAALAALDGLGEEGGLGGKRFRRWWRRMRGGRSRGRRGGRGGKASKKAKVVQYTAAGPSNTRADRDRDRDDENGEEDGDGDGDGDEMMMDIDAPLYPDVIQDSDVEDETFIGKLSSDIEMGDADAEDEREEDDEEEGEEGVRRTKRPRKIPVRYTR